MEYSLFSIAPQLLNAGGRPNVAANPSPKLIAVDIEFQMKRCMEWAFHIQPFDWACRHARGGKP
jgi:hypothetical protein